MPDNTAEDSQVGSPHLGNGRRDAYIPVLQLGPRTTVDISEYSSARAKTLQGQTIHERGLQAYPRGPQRWIPQLRTELSAQCIRATEETSASARIRIYSFCGEQCRRSPTIPEGDGIAQQENLRVNQSECPKRKTYETKLSFHTTLVKSQDHAPWAVLQKNRFSRSCSSTKKKEQVHIPEQNKLAAGDQEGRDTNGAQRENVSWAGGKTPNIRYPGDMRSSTEPVKPKVMTQIPDLGRVYQTIREQRTDPDDGQLGQSPKATARS